MNEDHFGWTIRFNETRYYIARVTEEMVRNNPERWYSLENHYYLLRKATAERVRLNGLMSEQLVLDEIYNK